MEIALEELQVQKYSAYKDSGVEWLGEIPEHWEVRRLRYIADCFPSNVDKHTRINEISIRLCNYTDVYKNDFILNDLNFMVATATYEQIQKYTLKEGDVVITKDSETASDIAVPAYVIGKLENVICGYHLAVIRPTSIMNGKYIFRLFQSKIFNAQFEVCSNGITRVGLGNADLKKGQFLLPPKEEQTAIANFLDSKTALIDQAIGIKQKQIELLKERRQLLIHKAVTRGLNPHVKMKDSGVEWIGEVPEGWEVKRLRFVGKTQNGVSKGGEYFGAGFPFVNYGDVYKDIQLPKSVYGLAESSIADRIQYAVLKGDIFFTRTSETVEEIGFSSTCLTDIKNAIFSGFLIRFRPYNNVMNSNFSKYYFSSKTHRNFFVKEMNLVIRASLSQDLLKQMQVLIPPVQEQIDIANYLDKAAAQISTAISIKEKEIDKLKEYKSTLINSAVTGKIKIS